MFLAEFMATSIVAPSEASTMAVFPTIWSVAVRGEVLHFGDEGNAYFDDLTDQSNRSTDILVHSSTVHARGDIVHIEAVMVGEMIAGR